ncbi:MAG TPA: NADH-quinone oxidoreductase subunit NuoK [Cytophagales bacterium]|nr:NADH-quinone oxidoreductase subunit NuoK [Cytophagales bacterium]
MIPIEHFLYIGAALFALGIVIIITKKNAIMVLMGIELLLNAANINLVAFSRHDPSIQGQFFALFVIVVAAAEASVALAIVLRVYDHFRTAELNKIKDLQE